MSMKYQTEAVNRDGGNGTSAVRGGLTVTVASPLSATAEPDPSATNPEQLLALAWATCLNATARAIIADEHRTSVTDEHGTSITGDRRTSVRVEVELHSAESGPGYEFHVDAYLSVEDSEPSEAERVLAAAHARCPVSRLLHSATTVRVHTEPYRD